jgi:Lon protease-like protein
MVMDDLPDFLPIFPLEGALLLPRGQLPLNIFEPRYLAMVDEALKTHRLIGMIQPKNASQESSEGHDVPLYDTGCAGRVTGFQETADGRYLITLTGVSRFRVTEELPLRKGFRTVRAHWNSYYADRATTPPEPALCRTNLKKLLRLYFDRQGLECDWSLIDDAPPEKLVNCLSMICPFTPCEKQALLEAPCCDRRAQLLLTILEMDGCPTCDESNKAH